MEQVICLAIEQKYRHLLKNCEDIDGHLEYRFAKHPRFVLWLYNLHYRHRTLPQGKIFLQQNPGNANMATEDLKELIDQPARNKPIITQMTKFIANVPGTPAYLHRASQDLSAIKSSNGRKKDLFKQKI